MRARDLMVPIHDYLTPESNLKEAVNLLKTASRGEGKTGVMGLPVLDQGGRFVGMALYAGHLFCYYEGDVGRK